MHIANLRHPRLAIDEFTILDGEFWCAYGGGRSGINEFLTLIEGNLSGVQADALQLPRAFIISFSSQQEIYEEELRNDDSDYLDRPDPGTLAREFLPVESLHSDLIDAFDMRSALDTGYRQLSSGQGRKLLLLQALLSGSSMVVLDSPYDGLDPLACRELDRAFSRLKGKRLRILVLVRNIEDIPGWCDKLAFFQKARLIHRGASAEIRSVAETAAISGRLFRRIPSHEAGDIPDQELPRELIRLEKGFAGYGEKIVFTDLTLRVGKGQHTLITGPNGCGKSTLLHLVTGDNPKCYANDLKVFGIQRGSGETIWELKKYMGIVTPELHRGYRVPGTALHVVLSGLFDSIGLYRRVTASQERQAREWLAAIDMEESAAMPFRSLSYGDQRLVLIARALIKQPPLLILDEPTQGLDSTARRSLLDFLETISHGRRTTILYVSHRQDEYRTFFRQHLRLDLYHQADGTAQDLYR